MKKTTRLLLFLAMLLPISLFADANNYLSANLELNRDINKIPFSNALSTQISSLTILGWQNDYTAKFSNFVEEFISKTGAPYNEYSPLMNATYSNLTGTASRLLGFERFGNTSRVIDNNLNKTFSYTSILLGSSWIDVKDNSATGSNVYPAGSYAGFILNDVDLLSIGGSSKV